MSGSYSPLLVLFSLLVAMLASYTALDMASRLASARDRAFWGWLAGGTFAMGLGVWSMHFIGMLAFQLPIPMGYDLDRTLYSMVCSLAASALALWLTSKANLPMARLILGAIVMGAGIAGMHYLGMASLRMDPHISYDPVWFGLSIVIAMLASGSALWLAHSLRGESTRTRRLRLLASLVMGVAIVGMHYTGMAAAQFAPDAICGAAGINGLDPNYLAVLVIVATVALMCIALFASLFDHRMRVRTSALSDSLAVANRKLRHAVLHDALTGLPNRVLLQDRIEQAISSGLRRDQLLAVLFIDIDGFQSINDGHGLHCGDQLLCELSDRLQTLLLKQSSQSTLARLGADEFVAVCPVANPDEAAVLATRLNEVTRQPFHFEDNELVITISIGITLYPEDADCERELMSHGSTALHYAKQGGRNSHAFFTPSMQQSVEEQMRLLQDMHRAIERDELVLFYQPKFDASGQKMIGAEALLRWQHPVRGLMSPDKFIPLAERSGLMLPIGRWVLNRACAQLRNWHDAGHTEWTIAVNLSPVQFTSNDLTGDVHAALLFHEIPAHCLTLEVTESTAMHDVEASLIILNELTSMGVRISIDDFGTGYSSLLYLKRMPATELKIDRAFIRDLGNNDEDASIVEAIIALGRTLQMRIVAEGVETAEQQIQLDAMGCDQLQGYHFNPPLPAEKFNAQYSQPANG